MRKLKNKLKACWRILTKDEPVYVFNQYNEKTNLYAVSMVFVRDLPDGVTKIANGLTIISAEDSFDAIDYAYEFHKLNPEHKGMELNQYTKVKIK